MKFFLKTMIKSTLIVFIIFMKVAFIMKFCSGLLKIIGVISFSLLVSILASCSGSPSNNGNATDNNGQVTIIDGSKFDHLATPNILYGTLQSNTKSKLATVTNCLHVGAITTEAPIKGSWWIGGSVN